MLDSYTWIKDSQNLFDYESSSFIHNSFNLEPSATFTRNDNSIESFPINLQLNNPLINAERSIKGYKITPASKNKVWRVVKSLRFDEGYRLSPGQFIKLGRKTFKIRSFNAESDIPYIFPSTDHKETDVCRVCFSQSQTDDPFIVPCECKGSIKYAHLKCFQQFISNRISIYHHGGCIKYCVNTLNCEISKCEISRKIIKSSLMFDIININSLKKPYIIIEYNNEKSEYILYVIQIQTPDQKIWIGRSTENDVRLTDISISRKHAMISFNSNSFRIYDNNSRFGTLVEEKQVFLDSEQPEALLQCGRTIFNFKVI